MGENIEVMECNASDLVFNGSVAESEQERKIKGDQFIQMLSEILAGHHDKEQKI